MKKLAGLLLVLSFLRIGFAYADTNTVNSVEYLTGTSDATDPVNQILVTLIGPQGEPGAAGVAGKDGVNGLNGVDGANGIDGAPGVAGIPGSAGESVQLVGDATTAECPSGGKVFSLAGVRTPICNGAAGANGLNGAAGATGATGSAGTGGTGVGGGFTYAQGEMSAGACDTFIAIKPYRDYTRIGFVFGGFTFGDTTITKLDTVTSTTLSGGVNTACLTSKVTIEFFTDSTYDSSKYTASDHIVCESRQTLASYGPSGNGTYTLDGGLYNGNTASNGGDFLCRSDVNNNITLAAINTADYNDRIGFSIG